MLSRVANNLFWIGRYMERSYGILLTTKISFSKAQDYNSITSDSESTKNDFSLTLQQEIFDTYNLNSVYNLTYKARENCRSVQEEVSRELWLCINNNYLYLKKIVKENLIDDDPLKIVDDLLQQSYLYYGIADLTQERGSAFCFMNCGKYFERIFRTLNFFESNLITNRTNNDLLVESIYWKNLLLSIGGYQLYLRTYKSEFKLENIVDMLVFNKNFPHSIYYSIKKLETHLLRLNENNTNKNHILFLTGKLESYIKYSTLEDIFENKLDIFINRLETDLLEISTKFNERYFSNY